MVPPPGAPAPNMEPPMTPTPTLYRWALLDKAGKTRMTCEKEKRSHAKAQFEFDRGRAIPKGWKIVNRGPAKPFTNTASVTLNEPPAMGASVHVTGVYVDGKKIEPTPELPSPRVACGECEGGWLEESKTNPGVWGCLKCGRIAPRPFQVGDRVRRTNKDNTPNVPIGSIGTVVNPNCYGSVVVKWDHTSETDGEESFPMNLQLIPNEPKEETPAPVKIGDTVEGIGYATGKLRVGEFLGYDRDGNARILDPEDKNSICVKRDTIKLVKAAELEPKAAQLLEEAHAALKAANERVKELEAERETIIAQKDALIETIRESLRGTTTKLFDARRELAIAKDEAENARNELNSIATRMESDELAQRLGNAFYQGACMGLEIATPKA